MPRFADTIVAWRKRRGMTQQDLVKATKISKNGISLYERGGCAPSIERIELIAKALSITIKELLQGPDPPPPPPAKDLPWHGKELSAELRLIPYLETWGGKVRNTQKAPLWPVSQELAIHHHCLVTRIHCDSMAPELQAGDAVVVDPHQQRGRSGGMVLVRVGRRCAPRRYVKRRGVHLLEANSSSIEPRPVTDWRAIAGAILGVVERPLQLAEQQQLADASA